MRPWMAQPPLGREGLQQNGGGLGYVQALDLAAALDADFAAAGRQHFGGNAMFLVAQHQCQRPVSRQGGEWHGLRAQSGGGGAEMRVQAAQGAGHVAGAENLQIFQRALGGAVGGAAGHGAGAGFVQQQGAHTEEGGAAGDGAEIMRVAYLVQHQQQFAFRHAFQKRDFAGLGDRGQAAMVHRARGFLHLVGRQLAIGALAAGQFGAEGAREMAGLGSVEKTGHVIGPPVEHSGNGVQPAKNIQLHGARLGPLPDRVNSARTR